MIIKADGDTLVNTQYVTKIYIGGRNDNTSLRADLLQGGSSEIGRYSKKNISQFVLDMIASTWAADERIFEMPNEKDVVARMSLPKSTSIHVKTKENRHGGS